MQQLRAVYNTLNIQAHTYLSLSFIQKKAIDQSDLVVDNEQAVCKKLVNDIKASYDILADDMKNVNYLSNIIRNLSDICTHNKIISGVVVIGFLLPRLGHTVCMKMLEEIGQFKSAISIF